MDVEQVRKAKKMDFGCGVVHDQERCVLCGRCVRFCRQITETGELGIVNRTDAARVTTFPGRPLDNRYALNVVDLCPVGAMTSKDFRFKQRVWFMAKDEGICHGCSKGCNIYIDHHREKYKDDLIYRFRPRFNEQVNGYFICDQGRLSYSREIQDRLLEPLRKGKIEDLGRAVERARQILARAKKTLILVSPNLTIEQLIASRQFAAGIGAELSGYSDGYIIAGDGDDFLIQDDKSANRRGLDLLEVDSKAASFYSRLEEADCLICIDHDLRGTDAKKLKKGLRDTPIIVLSAYLSSLAEKADVALPVASFTEYSGTVVNCDNVLQSFSAAVVRNNPIADATGVLQMLGETLGSREEILAAIHKLAGPLTKVDFNQIPKQGLKL